MSTVRFKPNEVTRRCDVRPDEEWRTGYGRAWLAYDYEGGDAALPGSNIFRTSDQWVEVRTKRIETERITLVSALRDGRKLRGTGGNQDRWLPIGSAVVGADNELRLLSRAGQHLVGPAYDGYVEALVEDS